MNIEKNITLFGGSFDPPTIAHEAIIRNCLDDAHYDEVWIMPSGMRTDKPHMHSDALRLDWLKTMRRANFNADERLIISGFELSLPQPTETYNTYQMLRSYYPDTTFWFVYGADSIATMHTWQHGDYLRQQLAMIAIPRAGYDLPSENAQLRHIAFDDIYNQDISSSEVRARIACHRHYQHMVSTAVAAQIEQKQLYAEIS